MSSKRNLLSSTTMKAIYGIYPVLPTPRKNVAIRGTIKYKTKYTRQL